MVLIERMGGSVSPNLLTFLTRERFREEACVSKATVDRWLKMGKVRSILLSRRCRRIPRSEIDRLVDLATLR